MRGRMMREEFLRREPCERSTDDRGDDSFTLGDAKIGTNPM